MRKKERMKILIIARRMQLSEKDIESDNLRECKNVCACAEASIEPQKKKPEKKRGSNRNTNKNINDNNAMIKKKDLELSGEGSF